MTGSLEDRFARHVEEARLFESARTLVVAHSGGSDSTALLLLAAAWASARGVAVMSAHVAHGLRGEAGEEDARFCARLATTLSGRFTLHPVGVPSERGEGESLEAAAPPATTGPRRSCSTSSEDSAAPAEASARAGATASSVRSSPFRVQSFGSSSRKEAFPSVRTRRTRTKPSRGTVSAAGCSRKWRVRTPAGP